MNLVMTTRVLLKSAPVGGRTVSLAGSTFQIRELCPNELLDVVAVGAAPPARWYLAELGARISSASPADAWDMAYQISQQQDVYAEPDIGVQWDYQNRVTFGGLGAAAGDLCVYNDQSQDFPKGSQFAWHLDLSQLRSARTQIGPDPSRVRIGIMDTGFDFNHQARPDVLLTELQRNFVDDGPPENDASDPFPRGPFTNPGHGTGTIGLLAGRRLLNMARREQNGDYLGGAPLAEVLPVRIATGVVLLHSSAFVAGLDYLIAPNGNRDDRVDVMSMSMGGLPSRAWAEVVNRAYEAGIVMVTAAGNNFTLTPESIVYPARFRRVIAACGVMADGKPYIRENVPFGKMAGNYGPESKMDTAIAAYTPNTSWAEINCAALVDMDGAGTSSATPQVAAAAALWLQKHKRSMSGWSPSEIVEATRKALFKTAHLPSPDLRKYFGCGILRAADALGVPPQRGLSATPPDSAQWASWKVLTGRGFALNVAHKEQQEMLGVELAQLFLVDRDVANSVPDPDDVARDLPDAFFDAVIGSPYASRTLKAAFKARFPTTSVPGADLGKDPGPHRPNNQSLPTANPTYRFLRAYATDPSLSGRLSTSETNEVIVPVPWESLGVGPVGEYLEVIDHDPASGCYYAPIDLEEHRIIANNGLYPNAGDPRFHQQMAYAVAMRTIHNFEIALGRKALWSPIMAPGSFDDSHYVRRLRIYPHALRDQNAYYDPVKKALLFGYFPVQGVRSDELYPDGIVFTCLSHDIVAHETTHALLDGMHRNLTVEASVDDLAFHEAFADLVALFQHFSLPDVLTAEIYRTRGDLSLADRLADIGQEFGFGIGLHRALRSAIGRKPDPSLIDRMTEPHDRGSLLVAAVFGAFLNIYTRRTDDLVRIATGGTGVLMPGAIHPDLVARLASEARKTAQHVLIMCIRALDYFPPVDLDFGDYLRAIITADYDVVPDDKLQYRVAFVESFRNWRIYPTSMQTLSPQSLRWRELQFDQSKSFLTEVLSEAREFVDGAHYLMYHKCFDSSQTQMPERERQFYFSRNWRINLHEELRKRLSFASSELRAMLGADLGLDFSTGRELFEVHSLRVADKVGPNNEWQTQLILQLIQHRTESVDGRPFRFAGGTTLVVDAKSLAVRYSILRNIRNQARLDRARRNQKELQGPRQTYLAGTPFTASGQQFAAMHRFNG